MAEGWQNCGVPDYILDGVHPVHPDNDGGLPEGRDLTVDEDNAYTTVLSPLSEKRIVEHVKVTKVELNVNKENAQESKVCSVKDFLLCYSNPHSSLIFIISLYIFSFFFSNYISILLSTFILVFLVIVDILCDIGIGVMIC